MIAIFSSLEDQHSLAVKNAVEKLGGKAAVIDPMLHFSTISLRQIDTSPSLTPFHAGRDLDIRSVWLRRPVRRLNAGAANRELEILAYASCVTEAIALRASLVSNPLNVALDFESKYRGLMAASEVGFQVPRTLMSANAAEVNDFYDEMSGRLIYKPHRQHQETKRGTFSGAAAVTKEMLRHTEAIESAPGVYQELLTIDYEIRVLVVGRTTVAAQVRNNSRFIDSRIMLGSSNTVSAVQLSPSIAEKCIDLVRDNGLTSGSIDLAIAMNGDAYFLDLNASGQFLWMEYFCPAVPALDTFARFLFSGEADFSCRPAPEHERLTLRQCPFVETQCFQ